MLDVALVLLLAFMMLAPALKYGVQVNLPEVANGAPPLDTDQRGLAVVRVGRGEGGAGTSRASGTGVGAGAGTSGTMVLLDGRSMGLGELEAALTRRKDELGGRMSVEVELDKAAPVEAFLDVAAAAKRAGVESIGVPVKGK